MVYNDPEEMRLLTAKWAAYLENLRLKLLLCLHKKVISFLNGLEFIACEENFEQIVAYNLAPFFENVDLPDYKLTVRYTGKIYELKKFSSPCQWLINIEQPESFFAIDKSQAANFADILDKFDVFVILARIRTEDRLARYKAKYVAQPETVSDVICENNEYLLVLQDGVRAKLLDSLT